MKSSMNVFRGYIMDPTDQIQKTTRMVTMKLPKRIIRKHMKRCFEKRKTIRNPPSLYMARIMKQVMTTITHSQNLYSVML